MDADWHSVTHQVGLVEYFETVVGAVDQDHSHHCPVDMEAHFVQFEVPTQLIHLLHQQLVAHLHLVVCCCYVGSDNILFAFLVLFADQSFADCNVAYFKAGDYKITQFNQNGKE